MKGTRVVTGLAVLSGAFLALGSCTSKPAPATAAGSTPVERGRYLVTIGGCHDCHSPKVMGERGPEPDPSRLLSGHPSDAKLGSFDAASIAAERWILVNDQLTAAVGPWGVSFASNLTPDKETGIGGWPEAMFVAALRNGKHMGSGRPILPPMPWPNLAAASDDDLRSIYAYLQSIEPVRNQVPEPIAPPAAPLAAKM